MGRWGDESLKGEKGTGLTKSSEMIKSVSRSGETT